MDGPRAPCDPGCELVALLFISFNRNWIVHRVPKRGPCKTTTFCLSLPQPTQLIRYLRRHGAVAGLVGIECGAIHAQESREAADKAQAIVEDLRATKMGKAADLVEQAVHETLTYHGFPDIHWQKIRTNNPLERIIKEIRRRTRVVGAFPDGGGSATTAHRRNNVKCYMNMRPLYQQQPANTPEARMVSSGFPFLWITRLARV